MRCLSKNPIPRFLFLITAIFLLIGCSAVDRFIHPAAKPGSPAEPVVEQGKKEETPATPPSEPAVAVPAGPLPLPSPPPYESPKVALAPSLHVTEVVWSFVNLREGPGLNYKVVGNVKKGTSLAILEEKGQWLHVRLEGGNEVWVFKSATLLAPKPQPSATPPKPKPM
jgi:Bacterial SH3 domain